VFVGREHVAMMKIHLSEHTVCGYKALIAAEYNGVKLQREVVSGDLSSFSSNPLSLINSFDFILPVLQTESGFLWGSNAIARHVARLSSKGNLYGNSSYEQGLIDQWVDFSRNELDLPVQFWLRANSGEYSATKAAIEAAKEDLQKVFNVLDEHLLQRTFLVSNGITLADIAVSISLLPLFQHQDSAALRTPFVNVNRWFATCLHQPPFSSVVDATTVNVVLSGDTTTENTVEEFPLTEFNVAFTTITFKNPADAINWRKNDKYWIFGERWKAKTFGQTVVLNWPSADKEGTSFSQIYHSQLTAVFQGVGYQPQLTDVNLNKFFSYNPQRTWLCYMYVESTKNSGEKYYNYGFFQERSDAVKIDLELRKLYNDANRYHIGIAPVENRFYYCIQTTKFKDIDYPFLVLSHKLYRQLLRD